MQFLHRSFCTLTNLLARRAPSVNRRSLAATIAATVIVPLAYAADPYPSRPVELLVPFTVGGGTDAVARAFADTASKYFPKPIVVLNRPGAAGAIGHQEGARAPADGYKLTMVTPEISLAFLQGIGKARFHDFTF